MRNCQLLLEIDLGYTLGNSSVLSWSVITAVLIKVVVSAGSTGQKKVGFSKKN
jgi:hypothetical protein